MVKTSCKSSIVIPVFNKWELTHPCLESLARTLPGEDCEIIIIDNASSDETPSACPQVGNALFGDRFVYHRCDKNTNFGPASNLGARLAKGEYLVLLNNDTVAKPDWYPPLLDDFSQYPNIFATGPILTYPNDGPFGEMVQHLGVCISPFYQVEHLYGHLPVASPFVCKRRFLQCITAACMMMPRAVFLNHGGFDEQYINGCEDVDLCARLYHEGFRATINPKSRMVHHCSQTLGRHDHLEANTERLRETSLQYFTPDMHLHLRDDDLVLEVTDWATLAVAHTANTTKKLSILLKHAGIHELKSVLIRFPYWREGYGALAKLYESQGDMEEVCAIYTALARFSITPEYLLPLHHSAQRTGQLSTVNNTFEALATYCKSFPYYENNASSLKAWASKLGLKNLSARYQAWEDNAERLYATSYIPFLQAMREITKTSPAPLSAYLAYTVWQGTHSTPKEKEKPKLHCDTDNIPAFSVLMPVYNPDPVYLRKAVDSLIRQSWPHWELCMADDASPDPGIKLLLEEITGTDPRIKVVYREKNGHIAAATNTALGIAQNEFVALLDQDDLLPPDALEVMAEAITQNPQGLLFYSDEDKIADDGSLFSPYFKKNKWDTELLTGQNCVSHLGVYRTDRLKRIGGFRDGFNGSQDYDLVLRYSENLPESALVHIPKVLYHWRCHAGSTAYSIAAKPEALMSSEKAMNEHLERSGYKAKAKMIPGRTIMRVHYALPQPPPFASLIIDLGNDLGLAKSHGDTIAGLRKEYPACELVLGYDTDDAANMAIRFLLQKITQQPFVRAYPLAGKGEPERLNELAGYCAGQVYGFMGKGVYPKAQGWLDELVSRLYLPGVGAIGGRVLQESGSILHAGYSVDGSGRLAPMFKALPRGESYFAWSSLARSVDALDSLCLFTKAEDFAAQGGFAATMSCTCAFDYCLRLQEKGLRSVVTPFADCVSTLLVYLPWLAGRYVQDPAFTAKWDNKLAPVHPYLLASPHGWDFNW